MAAKAWLEEFNIAITLPKPPTHALRMKIMRGTWSTFADNKYTTEEGETIIIDHKEIVEDLRKDKMYKDEHVFSFVAPKHENTDIEVINGDCLEVAYGLKFNKLLNPAVLNMANAHTPGGGYKSGSGAQEENLHRRSNLFQHLEDPDRLWKEKPWYYPIPEFGAIYSPSVLVVRGTEAEGYPFIKPYRMAIISCAAYSRPRTGQKAGGPPFLLEEPAEGTKNKIRAILRAALDNGHDSVVLSAFGCGAYRNPPAHIASLFNEVLHESEFDKSFKHVSFAILDDHNAGKKHNPEGNFRPFVDVFCPNTANVN